MNPDLIAQLKILESVAKQLDPTSEQRQAWAAAVIDNGEAFLNSLDEAAPAVFLEQPAKAILQHPPTEAASPLEEVLPLISQNIQQIGLKPASGGYLAYIPGGGVYPSALGDYLAAVGNHYAGVFYGSPGAVRMENQLIRWTAELLGFDPDQIAGNLTSGGSYATLIGIHTARSAKQIKAREIENTVVYMSSQTHHAAIKALRVAGLGEAIMREVPLDAQFRMQPLALQQMIEEDIEAGNHPFLLIASLGTTDVGAVDPIDELADMADEYDLWFHVDGAYGGYFALDPAHKDLFKGLGRADSVVIDPHKSLFIALGTGMIIIKDRQHMIEANRGSGAYLQDYIEDPTEYSPAQLSPELSKHFRGLRMWLPLKLFGLAPFRAALQEKRLLTLWAYEQLSQIEGLEIPLEPQLTVLLFRYLPEQASPNDFNQAMAKAIQRSGRVFLSTTSIEGKYYLRLAIVHFRAHLEQVQYAVSFIKAYIETHA
ncbi:MAG: aminotransferase class V-fold PLP-dependent enzyme [Bacteroidota bacterium]